jgi:FKBP-type peptidyl-prolyl cis-trans isomerase FklB
MDKLSYSLGVNIGEGMKQQGFGIKDFESFTKGIKDVFANSIELSPDEMNKLLNDEFQRVQTEVVEAQKSAGIEFLAENAKREGVIVTESGLQYEILKEGDGPIPTLSDSVTTHYHGTLPDGKVFDSSVQRNEPATFPVSGVIKGWTEALQLMKTGSKYKLYVPSDLAYGERGAGGDIGPHQTLIFEVELLSIQ